MDSIDPKIAEDAVPGDELQLDFKYESLRWVRLLHLLIRDRYLYANRSECRRIAQIVAGGAWPFDNDQRFVVTVTEHFDAALFVRLMENALEFLQLTPAPTEPMGRKKDDDDDDSRDAEEEVDLEKIDMILRNGLTTRKLGQLVGVTHNVAKDWSRSIGKKPFKLCQELGVAAAIEALHQTVVTLANQGLSPAEISQWWENRNGLLHRQRPQAAFKAREFVRVEQAADKATTQELQMVAVAA